MRARSASGRILLIRASATGTAKGIDPTSVNTKICSVVPKPESNIPDIVVISMLYLSIDTQLPMPTSRHREHCPPIAEHPDEHPE